MFAACGGCGKSFGSAYAERKSQLRSWACPHFAYPSGEAVPATPTLSADALLAQLRGRFEQLCQDVAVAVNQAPAGQIINASEEKVRDLLADFRQATYQAAVQLRTDAAQAAFSPSAPPPDWRAAPEQGGG